MNKTIIIDASIATKWIVPEHDSQQASILLTEWKRNEYTLLAPVLFVYEITNILYRKALAGDIAYEDIAPGLINILSNSVELDKSTDKQLSLRAIELAHQFRLLATYDAHYLALAEREGCEFWTADTRLWRAVRDKLEWVHTLAEDLAG